MTVKEIIENYLVCHGFGGLVDSYRECACKVGDLAPCGEFPNDCEPGHKVDCTSACDHGVGVIVAGDWHVQIEKPEGVEP